jgi:xanthine/CO dehydrogenase XdhC/CoxF family maturation factor
MSTARRVATVGGDWLRQGKRVVSALLVAVEGSAPLAPGASMLISEQGEIEMEALEAIARGRSVAIATVLDGEGAGAKLALIDDTTVGSLGAPELLDHSVARDAAGMLAQGVTGIRRYGRDGAVLGAEVAVHIRSFAAPPTMLIFDAVDFSLAMARIASELGYAVTVCDPREPFLRSAGFDEAAKVRLAWPDEVLSEQVLGPRDAVLVFTHDPKFDEPALRGALLTGASLPEDKRAAVQNNAGGHLNHTLLGVDEPGRRRRAER